MQLSESDIVKKITDRDLSSEAKAEMLGALGIDSRQVLTFQIEVQSDVIKGAMSEELLRKLLKKEGFDSKIDLTDTRQGYIASGGRNSGTIYAHKFFRASTSAYAVHIASDSGQGSYCGKLYNDEYPIKMSNDNIGGLYKLKETNTTRGYYHYSKSISVPGTKSKTFCKSCWNSAEWQKVIADQKNVKTKIAKS